MAVTQKKPKPQAPFLPRRQDHGTYVCLQTRAGRHCWNKPLTLTTGGKSHESETRLSVLMVLSLTSWYPHSINLIKSKTNLETEKQQQAKHYLDRPLHLRMTNLPLTTIHKYKFTESNFRMDEECHFQRRAFLSEE